MMRGALCLAKLRLDGFVSLDAEGEGTVVTERFTLNGADLYVNADVPHGELRAEILDAETMQPLSGAIRRRMPSSQRRSFARKN